MAAAEAEATYAAMAQEARTALAVAREDMRRLAERWEALTAAGMYIRRGTAPSPLLTAMMPPSPAPAAAAVGAAAAAATTVARAVERRPGTTTRWYLDPALESALDDDVVVADPDTATAAAAAAAAAAAVAAAPPVMSAAEVEAAAFATAAAAIRSGMLARVTALPAAAVAARGAGGWTTLMVAVAARDADAVEVLLAALPAGPARTELVNAVNTDGDCAVHLALGARPSVRILRALVGAGADAELRNAAGHTVVDVVHSRYRRQAALATAILKVTLRLRDDEELPVCAVCFDGSVDTRLAACGHQYCKACLVGHVHAVVAAGGVYEHMTCPSACGAHLTPAEVHRLLVPHPAMAAVLETRARDAAATAMPGFEWCVRCAAGAVYDIVDDAVGGAGGSCTTRACAACPAVWCMLCRGEHTAAVSCDTYRASGEAASAAWIAGNTKPCPRCGVRGVRERGCSHIRCRCGANYCYLCLGPYITGVYTYEMAGACGCAARRAILWGEVSRRRAAAAVAAGTRTEASAAAALRAALDAAAAGGIVVDASVEGSAAGIVVARP
mgnify:CR=1 FL=1